MVRFDYLNVRDEKVQSFLWKWIEPSHFGFGMSRLDAMKELERRLLSKQESLYGDMTRGIALRVAFPRPDVAMPHVMGDGAWIRSMTHVSAAVLFGMGMTWVHIWTQDERIARIVEAFGYKRQATLDGHGFVVDAKEEITYVLTLHREAFYRSAAKLEVVNG